MTSLRLFWLEFKTRLTRLTSFQEALKQILPPESLRTDSNCFLAAIFFSPFTTQAQLKSPSV